MGDHDKDDDKPSGDGQLPPGTPIPPPADPGKHEKK